MKQFLLGSTDIDKAKTPYVIAEIGVNHEGSLEKAYELISLAKEGGADAVKFQTYKADKIASINSPSYWDLNMIPIKNQHELFKKFDSFNEIDYRKCAEKASSVGIDFISTPFDAGAVDFLDGLVPFFKVASADITNIPMLRQIAKKGKPVVLSTGASTISEIEASVRELGDYGCSQVVLLQCILNYPTAYDEQNLNMIKDLQRLFPDTVVGISDHTIADDQMLGLTAAYVLGAKVIEKHFTHDKTMAGNDHLHSMDVSDLKRMISNFNFIAAQLGDGRKRPLASEAKSRANARRSIIICRDLKAGDVIEEKDLTYKRPGTGISPKYWDDVIGMKLVRDKKADDLLSWVDLVPST